jgi:hypothetical protein
LSDSCELRAANGIHGQDCDGRECIYWRVVSYIGAEKIEEGCAITHFQLHGDEETAAWLLSVKERIERAEQEHGSSRP